MQVKIDALKVKALHEQGKSRKEIAKETGYPLKAVNLAFATLGIKREKTVYVIETESSNNSSIVDQLNNAIAEDTREFETRSSIMTEDEEL